MDSNSKSLTANTHQVMQLGALIQRQTSPGDAYVERFVQVLSHLPKLNFSNGPWLAGGSIRRLFDGTESESDFDLFFANEQQLQDHWCTLLDKGAKILYQNDHNITAKLPIEGSEPVKIQLIKFFFDGPEAVVDWFDYTNCQFITDGNTLLMGQYTLFDIGGKKLRVNNIHHAVSSVRRLLKYSRQGYTICDGTINEILQTVASNPTTIQEKVRYID